MEQLQQLLQAISDTRMGFALGLATVLIDVPPHWSAWLAGELGEWRLALWIIAAAAVVRGVLWLAFKLAGAELPSGLRAVTLRQPRKGE
jgi:hypothetical protein